MEILESGSVVLASDGQSILAVEDCTSDWLGFVWWMHGKKRYPGTFADLARRVLDDVAAFEGAPGCRVSIDLVPSGLNGYLREWRRSLGLSQVDLARRLGWTAAYLSMRESGKRPVWSDEVQRWVRLLRLVGNPPDAPPIPLSTNPAKHPDLQGEWEPDMAVWDNSIMECIYYDGDPADMGMDCQVRIDEDEIVVTYEEDDGGYPVYRGANDGTGHYVLQCPTNNGRATLHRFPNGQILEGYWDEDGCRGFWRIRLQH